MIYAVVLEFAVFDFKLFQLADFLCLHVPAASSWTKTRMQQSERTRQCARSTPPKIVLGRRDARRRGRRVREAQRGQEIELPGLLEAHARGMVLSGSRRVRAAPA